MHWTDIPGWTCDDMLALYVEAARRWPRGRFVEVGVAYGRSLAFLCSVVAEGSRVLGVDTWDEFMGGDNLPPDVFVRMQGYGSPYDACVAMMDGRWNAILLRMPSVDAAWRAGKGQPCKDLVFIDANHTYDDVRADIRAWLPLVKPGGILAGHDYSPDLFPGVVQAVDELLPMRTVHGVVWRVDVPAGGLILAAPDSKGNP